MSEKEGMVEIEREREKEGKTGLCDDWRRHRRAGLRDEGGFVNSRGVLHESHASGAAGGRFGPPDPKRPRVGMPQPPPPAVSPARPLRPMRARRRGDSGTIAVTVSKWRFFPGRLCRLAMTQDEREAQDGAARMSEQIVGIMRGDFAESRPGHPLDRPTRSKLQRQL